MSLDIQQEKQQEKEARARERRMRIHSVFIVEKSLTSTPGRGERESEPNCRRRRSTDD